MKKLIALLTVFSMAACTSGFSIEKDIQKLPYSGLVLDSVDLDGIKIEGFKFENDYRIIHVKPDEEFTCYFHYQIESKHLKNFNLHHVVIGLYDDGPQECVFHSLGIKDSSGSLAVSLKAPSEKGVYEVRFSRSKCLSCDKAKEDWWKESSHKSVLGFVVVL